MKYVKNFHISFKSFNITFKIQFADDFTVWKKPIKNFDYRGRFFKTVYVGFV